MIKKSFVKTNTHVKYDNPILVLLLNSHFKDSKVNGKNLCKVD